eukprot:g3129.t1
MYASASVIAAEAEAEVEQLAPGVVLAGHDMPWPIPGHVERVSDLESPRTAYRLGAKGDTGNGDGAEADNAEPDGKGAGGGGGAAGSGLQIAGFDDFLRREAEAEQASMATTLAGCFRLHSQHARCPNDLYPAFFGATARSAFFNLTRQVEQERQVRGHAPLPELTARTHFVNNTLEHCEGLLPLPAPLRRGPHSTLKLRGRRLGDSRMIQLAAALEGIPAVRGLDVADNDLTDRSMLPLLEAINRITARGDAGPQEARPKRKKIVQQKKQWRLEDSVFRPRPKQSDSQDFHDTDDAVSLAFQCDFERSKLGGLWSKEKKPWKPADGVAAPAKPKSAAVILAELKAVLVKHYRVIANVFRAYCSRSLTDPFSVSWNGFRELITNCNIVDPKDMGPCTLESCDSCFIAANLERSLEDKKVDNADKSLCRFELLEVFVRLADLRFGTGPRQWPAEVLPTERFADDIAQATAWLLERHVLPRAEHHANEVWRSARLYTESTHMVLKAYTGSLRELFNAYAADPEPHLSAKPDPRRYRLTIDSLFRLLEDRGMLDDDKLPKRDIALGFLQAKMVYIDEVAAKQRKMLTFVDFLEVVARLSEILTRRPGHRYGAWQGSEGPREVPLSDGIAHLLGTLGLQAAAQKVCSDEQEISTSAPKARDVGDPRLGERTVSIEGITPTMLVYLDLSGNKIDSATCTAIADFLRQKSCKLERFGLARADVDDSEARCIIEALEDNRSVTELDLSHNLLGNSEPLNTVFPDQVTGGEALAAMLQVNFKLRKLDLSWNCIAKASAVAFAAGLELNDSLTDLSH